MSDTWDMVMERGAAKNIMLVPGKLFAPSEDVMLVRFQLIKSNVIQPADIGWPTGYGKKLSSTQAQLSQATCLAVA